MPEVQLYIVCCTGMHGAVGPFASLEVALKTARRFTDMKTDSCVYVPVPLMTEGAVTVDPTSDKQSYRGADGHPGKYL